MNANFQHLRQFNNTLIAETLPPRIADIKKLQEDMLPILLKSQAVFISANQYGSDLPAMYYRKSSGELEFCLNPIILETQHSCRNYETSLSFPGFVCKVERFNKIKVEYLRPGKELEVVKKTLRSDEAFAFQAGMDQLNGICLLDKALSMREDAVLQHFQVYIQQGKPLIYRTPTGKEDFPEKFDYFVQNKMELIFSGIKLEEMPVAYVIGVDVGYEEEEPKTEILIP